MYLFWLIFLAIISKVMADTSKKCSASDRLRCRFGDDASKGRSGTHTNIPCMDTWRCLCSFAAGSVVWNDFIVIHLHFTRKTATTHHCHQVLKKAHPTTWHWISSIPAREYSSTQGGNDIRHWANLTWSNWETTFNTRYTTFQVVCSLLLNFGVSKMIWWIMLSGFNTTTSQAIPKTKKYQL